MRNTPIILGKKLGDMARGRDLGYKDHKREYVWSACPSCGAERWIPIRPGQTTGKLCHRCVCRLLIPKGENSHRWNGGRVLQENDYTLVYAPDHPRAIRRYVKEHILVWEETHGQSIPRDYLIHHINGLKADNRPQNLLALPRGKHHPFLYRQALQQQIRRLETEVERLKKNKAQEDSF